MTTGDQRAVTPLYLFCPDMDLVDFLTSNPVVKPQKAIDIIMIGGHLWQRRWPVVDGARDHN